ncbi:RHS repeat protein [Pseudomonas sp. ITA]|uniref:RHS repeat-associated core domain-containing protein n=1 Tax=Pseudomonas sp. ITA TaxID=2825841 RepID=UPI002498BEB5|nr:RHS repeat-associated core domain-containing protein [Pseudomonas sp. ITA]MDI2145863.1 RHS repeat protein [Pseudomonas sp. ITA]
MSTASNLTTAQLCRGTPNVTIIDNRGLSVRSLQYNRSAVGDTADERVTQQHFNALGQLIASLDPRLSSAQQNDPTVQANFRYQCSLSGKVLQTQSQDAGRQVAVFDVEGAPVWQENGRGMHKRHTYDALHRVSAVFEQDASGAPERVSEQYVYGERPEQFDTFGRLMRHYDTAGLNEVLHYNYRGQALQTVRQLLLDDAAHSDWSAAPSQWPALLAPERYQTSFTYNALEQVLSTVDAQGNRQQRYLNVAGQLLRSGLTLAGQSAERPVLASISYSADGQVLQETAGNGVVSTYTYEPQTLRLSRLTATRAALAGRSTLLQDLSYGYDPVGNILSISDAAIDTRYASNQQVEPIKTYQYDALYQLCSASGRENAGVSQQGPALPLAAGLDTNQYNNYTRQYQYDRGGNLTRIRHVGLSSYTLDLLVSSTSNRAVVQTGFLTSADVEGQFDAAGNLQQLGAGQPLLWDARNQLQRVTQVQRSGPDDDEEHYQYDGDGARVRKTTVTQTSGTTRRAQVIYLPGLEVRRTQRTQGGTTATEEELHVLGLGSTGRQQMRLLHWVTGQPADIPNDQLRGSLDNQVGSSLLELDQNAQVLTQEEYYPFGGTAVWSGRNTSETKYKFVRYSGKERDATGLYYYGLRYYAPWLGRWINPDPAGTVDGPNLYRMVRNNPATYMDPDGRSPERKQIIENYAQIKRYQHSAQQLSQNLTSSDARIAAAALANFTLKASTMAVNYGLGLITPPIPGLPAMLTGISGTIMGDIANRTLGAIGSTDLSTTLFSGQKTQILAATLPNSIEYGLAIASSNSLPLSPGAVKGLYINGIVEDASTLIWSRGAVAQTAYHAAKDAMSTVEHLESQTRELFASLGEGSASQIRIHPGDYVLNTLSGYDTPKHIKLGKALTVDSFTKSANSAKTSLGKLTHIAENIGYPARSWGKRQAEMSKHNQRAPLAYWSEGDIERKYPLR